MAPGVPVIEDYDITHQYGFLPSEWPLEKLTNPYYAEWEAVISNLPALILSKRIRETAMRLPLLSASHLRHAGEWQRAYTILGFMTQGYILAGSAADKRIPNSIVTPFLEVSKYLRLPPALTYNSVCIWNFKPLDPYQPIQIENLATLSTFTGSLDESWFYLIFIAVEVLGAPLISTLTSAISATQDNGTNSVISAFQQAAEGIEKLEVLLSRIYEKCDPRIFRLRVRPLLLYSDLSSAKELPNGIVRKEDSGIDFLRHCGPNFSAKPMILRFLDNALGYKQSYPEFKTSTFIDSKPHVSIIASSGVQSESYPCNYTHPPSPHIRFLANIKSAARIRTFVSSRPQNRPLLVAYNACISTLQSLHKKLDQVECDYLVDTSRESHCHITATAKESSTPLHRAAPIPGISYESAEPSRSMVQRPGDGSLIPFLEKAFDETGELAVEEWLKSLQGKTAASTPKPIERVHGQSTMAKNKDEAGDGVGLILAGLWKDMNNIGGLCRW